MPLPNSSKNRSFPPSDRPREPKDRRIEFVGWFLAPNPISRGPKNPPKIVQLAPKVTKTLNYALAFLGSWEYIGFLMDLGWIFDGCWWIWDGYLIDFWWISNYFLWRCSWFFISVTALLYYCITGLLYYCITASLCYCITVLYCITALLELIFLRSLSVHSLAPFLQIFDGF